MVGIGRRIDQPEMLFWEDIDGIAWRGQSGGETGGLGK